VKRTCIFLAGILLTLTSTSALAGAHNASAPARPALFHTVELRKTSLGKVLVNSSGSILYEFSKDPAKKDTCVKISGCSEIWPALPVQGRPSAGAGVKASLLSTIALSGGERQVTYAGHPLYIYGVAPRSTSYAGAKQFGGTWSAVNAQGRPVK
jgi:predicted lipoprotein with Yx(FWY)xxD motif